LVTATRPTVDYAAIRRIRERKAEEREANLPAWVIRLGLTEPIEFSGRWTRKLRRLLAWSQPDLAESLGVALRTVRHWEEGDYKISLESVLRLLVIELRYMATGEVPFEQSMIYELIAKGCRDKAEIVQGRQRVLIAERNLAIDQMIEGLTALKAAGATNATDD
jgi:transcriptional regulator with XRE-family HTH domain